LLAGVAITYGCSPQPVEEEEPIAETPVDIQGPAEVIQPSNLQRFDTGNDGIADFYIMEFTDTEGNYYLIGRDRYGDIEIEPIPRQTD
jgi:hypothetical protein